MIILSVLLLSFPSDISNRLDQNYSEWHLETGESIPKWQRYGKWLTFLSGEEWMAMKKFKVKRSLGHSLWFSQCGPLSDLLCSRAAQKCPFQKMLASGHTCLQRLLAYLSIAQCVCLGMWWLSFLQEMRSRPAEIFVQWPLNDWMLFATIILISIILTR